MFDHPSLYLFDIDGTMLHGGTTVHRESFAYAFNYVYGLPLTLDGVPASGRTDTWLLAEPLLAHGLSSEEIAGGRPAAFAAMEDYVQGHIGDLKHCVLPGVPHVLERLRTIGVTLALLTGNLEGIARVKLARAGLDHFFGPGGFGEESAVRADLVPVALRAASEAAGRCISSNEAIIVGDTPLDVEAGRAHGTRTCAVATGSFTEEHLRQTEADVVLPDLSDVDRAVSALLTLRNYARLDTDQGSVAI